MSYDNDDELDRLLFALPLEEPPADLRAAILTATIYRPAPVFNAWEISGIGAAIAVGVWLVVLIAMGGGSLFGHSMEAIGTGVSRVTHDAALMTWGAVGLAAALWLTLFTRFQPWQKVERPASR